MSEAATPSRKLRRRWLRFSLRTLLIASFLVGSGWLLRAKIPPWKLEYVLDISALRDSNNSNNRGFMSSPTLPQSSGNSNTFVISSIVHDSLPAPIGQHYKLYRNDAAWFECDFETTMPFISGSIVDPFAAHVSRMLSPDLSKLFLADQVHGVLYDLRGRRKLHEWRFAPENQVMTTLRAYATDGSRIAAIKFKRIYILDTRTGAIASEFDLPAGNLREAVFSPDAKALLLNFDESLALLDLASGALRFSHLTPHNTSYSNCTWLAGEQDVIVGNNYRDGVQWISAKTGEVVKNVWHIQPRSFEGFSPDGKRFIESLTERQKQGSIAKMTYTVRDSFSGVELFTTAAPVSEWGQNCIPKVSCSGDTCVLTNTDGDVGLWRLGSKERVARLQPPEMTKLPKLVPEPDPFPIVITCMWTKPAQHAVSYTATSTGSGDALYVEADEVGGVTRGYFLRRNHPEEWWGLACTGEFWLAVVLLVGIFVSLVADWRQLRGRLHSI
jgi:WD40 repeat protein